MPEGHFIRVCQLEPGNQADEVHVYLRVFDLSARPPYTALSYVWGSAEDKATIRCHGEQLKIPTNLLEALKAIRHPTLGVWLWADSICMDQQSTEEKNHQVASMGKIYAGACKVIAWLGADPDDIASDAFSLARQIARHEYPLFPRLHTTIPPRHEIEDDGEWWTLVGYFDPQAFSGLDCAEKQRWERLTEVYRRPWFTRRWVIQEVGLAFSHTSVMCSDKTIPWQQLVDAAACTYMRGHELAKHFNMYPSIVRCCEMYHVFSNWGTRPRFVEILAIGSRFGYVDLRDKVYAMLSHPSARTEDGNLIVQPDYSCSTYELDVILAIQFLEKFHSLQILSAVQHNKSKVVEDINFASWIPSWELPSVYGLLWHTLTEEWYQTADGTLPCFHISDSDTTLNVTGLLIGSIDTYDTVMRSEWFVNRDPDDAHHIEALISFISASLNSSNCTYSTSAERAEAYHKTLTAGNPTVSSKDFAAFKKARILDSAHSSDTNSSNEAGSSECFAQAAAAYSHHRRLFTTTKGYIGLGPRPTQGGDILCVLFGCPVPFVLQPSGERYRLVGECYVHGVMQGEAIQAWKRGEYTEQEFVLW